MQNSTGKNRNDRILALYLQCHTQQQIAEEVGTPQRTVSDVIASFSENGNIAESAKNFAPLLYNTWDANGDRLRTLLITVINKS